MISKIALISILFALQSRSLLGADAGIVIDTIKATERVPGHGRLTIVLDRSGYPSLSAADPKSPFYGDWLAMKKQLEMRGAVSSEEGQDRTTIALDFSQWPEGKPLPADKNRDFSAYRARMKEFSERYSRAYRNAHPWDAAALLPGSQKELEYQLFCWTLPVYMEGKGENFLPKFIADRAESLCSNVMKPFRYPAVAYHLCELDEEGISPGCETAPQVSFLTDDDEEQISGYLGSEWVESWSSAIFEPAGFMSSFSLPMQQYCSLRGSEHASLREWQELMQFKATTFLSGVRPFFDTSTPPDSHVNKTDWTGIMIGCGERFADIIASTSEAIEKTLANPRFDRNPWLSSLLYDIAKDYPDELANEEKIVSELNQKLKTEVYTYANGYSVNQLQPGIEFNRQVVGQVVEKKLKGAEILLLMLAETEASKSSPWRLEFKTKTEEERKAYLGILIKNITKECPSFGSDTVTDANCIMGWLSRFNSKQTPRIELKQFGKPTGFIRYGLR